MLLARLPMKPASASASRERFWAMQYPKSSASWHKAELSRRQSPRRHRRNYAAWSRANSAEQQGRRRRRSQTRPVAHSGRLSADYARSFGIRDFIRKVGSDRCGHPGASVLSQTFESSVGANMIHSRDEEEATASRAPAQGARRT